MDLSEIARRAGVSTATASRAINRVTNVDPLLSRRVWKVVDELGYYPNTQARALVSGKSRIFGLIVSEITNPFFPEIVATFERIAVEHGYEILLTSTVHDPKLMASSVRRMMERRVDGVAVITFGMEELLLEDLQLRQLPLVFVDAGPAPDQQYTHRLFAWHSPGDPASRSLAPQANRFRFRSAVAEISHRTQGRVSTVDAGNWIRERPPPDYGGESHDRRRNGSSCATAERPDQTHGNSLLE